MLSYSLSSGGGSTQETKILYSTAVNTLINTNGATLHGVPIWAIWAGGRYQVVTFPGFHVLTNSTVSYHYNQYEKYPPSNIYMLKKGAQLVSIQEGDATNPQFYVTDFISNTVYYTKTLSSAYNSGVVFTDLPWSTKFAILANNASTIELYKY